MRILNSLLNWFKILFFGKYLLRNQSHNNNVKVYYFAKNNIFRKVGENKVAYFYLKNELKGIKWYAKRLNLSEKKLIHEYDFSNRNNKIDIKKIEGKKRKFYSSTYKNEKFLYLCIDHYKKYWPKKKIVPTHGDLTLDNVIFKKIGLNFFDWEHFNKNGEIWGFDLAYLLISALVLPMNNSFDFSEKDKKSFCRLWKYLKLSGLKGTIKDKPIFYFKKTFLRKKHWKKIVNRSSEKLFPMQISDKNADKIHNLLMNS